MSWTNVIIAGASILGGVMANEGSKKAANAAGDASAASIGENRRQFDLVRADTAGQRFIGDAAIDTLSRLYGYGTPPSSAAMARYAGASPYQAPPVIDDGFFNTGAGAALNPWTVTSQLGDAGKILDPAGGLLGNVFGNKHGDEKRNLKAFTEENDIYDLGNGMLGLADGTTFRRSQLQDVAGAWYGATYAPDGDQEGWKQKYNALITKTAAPAAPASAPASGGGTPGSPDLSVFYASPDYQFNLGEGQKAIDRSASARGGLLSGGAVREGVRYASGLASREYSNFVDRLLQQAGLGATGIGASASAGANAAGNITSSLMNAGNAKASAYLTGAQGMNSAIQGGAGNLLLLKYLNG